GLGGFPVRPGGAAGPGVNGCTVRQVPAPEGYRAAVALAGARPPPPRGPRRRPRGGAPGGGGGGGGGGARPAPPARRAAGRARAAPVVSAWRDAGEEVDNDGGFRDRRVPDPGREDQGLAGPGPPRSPDRGRDQRAAGPQPLAGPGQDRRRLLGRREPGGRGQPERGPDGGPAGGPAGGGARRAPQPPLPVPPARS